MNTRLDKINELIGHHMGELILKELSLKEGVFVTVVKVDTTPDLRYTRVFISVYPEREIEYVLKTLRKEIYRLQGKLNRLLSVKPIPRIEFRADLTESKADEIEKLLKKI